MSASITEPNNNCSYLPSASSSSGTTLIPRMGPQDKGPSMRQSDKGRVTTQTFQKTTNFCIPKEVQGMLTHYASPFGHVRSVSRKERFHWPERGCNRYAAAAVRFRLRIPTVPKNPFEWKGSCYWPGPTGETFCTIVAQKNCHFTDFINEKFNSSWVLPTNK